MLLGEGSGRRDVDEWSGWRAFPRERRKQERWVEPAGYLWACLARRLRDCGVRL